MQEAGAGSTGPDLTFEFDLADLPYEVNLKVLKYIKQQSKPQRKADHSRRRLLEKKSGKAL